LHKSIARAKIINVLTPWKELIKLHDRKLKKQGFTSRSCKYKKELEMQTGRIRIVLNLQKKRFK
jgi:hypothetical protein